MASDKNYKEGQILIMFKNGIEVKDAVNIIESKNLTIKRRYTMTHSYLVEVPIGKEIELAGELQGLPEIESVGLNFKMQPC